ncbi:MAG: carbon-nitrogen hydrolase [Planctomycetes bacterium]|nr:carbon-nitrogen hydrolase [Planctomycetota bacterium]
MEPSFTIAQVEPCFADLDANRDRHLEVIAGAHARGDDVILFPELSLTGYVLRDATDEVALALDDAFLRPLLDATRGGPSVLLGLVERSRTHQLYNTALFLEDGEIKGRHRKVYLPTYGLFEEGRYFAAGSRFEPVVSRHGRFGVLVCEDLWHLSAGYLYFLDGVDALLVISAAPARGIAEEEEESSTGRMWQGLIAAHARFFQTPVLYANRVGFEDGILFWGGSCAHDAFGRRRAVLEGIEAGILIHRLDDGELRRARTASPLRRDERIEMVHRELTRRLDRVGTED